MGRHPSNGGPAFRFNPTEILSVGSLKVAEMETILQEHNTQVPAREVLEALAEKFSSSVERSGKIAVQMKQAWNWFQNRRFAIRAKAAKAPGNSNVTPMVQDDSTAVRNVPQAPQSVPAPSVETAGRTVSDSSQLEFEAKSSRDGAWYDVVTFLSHRFFETGDLEVLVRFAGFGPGEDEWVNVCRHVRQRSLPCESSECVAVIPGDLVLCFQEEKEQALYFDAHVLDAQRWRHDVRGCRCRFLVCYDHDRSEEIVPLRKVCRRPETEYRLQQLHAVNESASLNQHRTGAEPHRGNTLSVYPPAETMEKQQKAEKHAQVVVGISHAYTVEHAQIVAGASHFDIPVITETKVLEPKTAETNGACSAGNSIVPLGYVAGASATATSTINAGSGENISPG